MRVVSLHAAAGFAANCYLISEDGENAVAVDPSFPLVVEEAEKRGLKIGAALLTHGHFDHIGGCAAVRRAGGKVGCLSQEVSLAMGKENLSEMFGCPVEPFSVDFLLRDGETFERFGISFTVISTPGHTAGSCCYLACGGADAPALFSGDTLFCGDVGRCDLPTGDEAALKHSLKKLLKLPDCTVYPGHGMPTTLLKERNLLLDL